MGHEAGRPADAVAGVAGFDEAMFHDNRPMLARLCAFVIWALVAATAVFWGLRLWVTAPAAPAHAVAVGEAAALRGDLSRLLGAAPVAVAAAAATPEAASRFRLIGVMAPRAAAASAVVGGGVALIAMDGKPAKAYAVGAHLDGDVKLESVSLRAASIALGPGQPPVLLELAPLPAPATGTLPALLPPPAAAPLPAATMPAPGMSPPAMPGRPGGPQAQ
jgi:general secretion pathway protein C